MALFLGQLLSVHSTNNSIILHLVALIFDVTIKEKCFRMAALDVCFAFVQQEVIR